MKTGLILILIMLLVLVSLLFGLPIILGYIMRMRRKAVLFIEEGKWFRLPDDLCELLSTSTLNKNYEWYIKPITISNRGTFHALITDIFVRPFMPVFREELAYAYTLLLQRDFLNQWGYIKSVTLKPVNSRKGPRKMELALLMGLPSKPSGIKTDEWAVIKRSRLQNIALNIVYYDTMPIRIFHSQLINNDIALNPTAKEVKVLEAWQEDIREHLMELQRMYLEKLAEHSEEPVYFEVEDGTLCLKTPIIHTEEELIEYLSYGVRSYSELNGEPPYLVGISESVAAIAQGRIYQVYDVKPSVWARTLCPLFSEDSSMSSPYTFEIVLRHVGLIKLITGLWIGAIGLMLGKRGWFYAFVGRIAAAVDDCAGTTPPYDKYIVLPPREPDEYAKNLKKLLGCEVAIVDVNDLGAVDVLGLSVEENRDIIISNIKRKLRTNPQGNEDERRPFVFFSREELMESS